MKINRKRVIKNIVKRKNRYLFDNTVKGNFNISVYNASKEIVKKLGEKYNPLYIYGRAGSGKTHFLKTIKNEIVKIYPQKRVTYISGYDFMQMLTNSVLKNRLKHFKNSFRHADVLLIDDLNQIYDKPMSQNLLFKILNMFYDDKKQIIITFNPKGKKMADDIDERLYKSFSKNLVLKLEQPKYRDRVSIIENYIEYLESGINLNKNVINYLAKNIKHDIRKLEGAINNIVLYISACKREIDVKDLKEFSNNI